MPINGKPGSPPPPRRKDKYQLLNEENRQIRDELESARVKIAHYHRELSKGKGELGKANERIDRLLQVSQQSNDSISSYKTS
jgi:cell division septum initiation protein DivIVA